MSAPRRESSVTISSARRRYLLELAETLADDFCGDSPQVDPASILEEHGVTISYNDYGSCFDGMLHFEDGVFHVYCNEARGPRHDGRGRFTLAHELGHFSIPEHHLALRAGRAPSHPSFCSKPNAKNYVELEADFFASRLLMPEARFAPAIKSAGHGLGALCTVATQLGTSLQSTGRRFEDCDSHPCAMIVWRQGKEPWFVVSAALRRRGFIFVRRGYGPLPGSATAIAQADSVTSTPQIRESTSLTSQWFASVLPGTLMDIPLREEAMQTPFATLTWLTADPRQVSRLPDVTVDGISS
jgi:hypothetical protein